MATSNEKTASVQPDIVAQQDVSSDDAAEPYGDVEKRRETHEVFKQNVDGVEFRTVSWQRATIIFLKIQFAMSILAVPGALGTLGAVGGSLSIVGWTSLNICKVSKSGRLPSDMLISMRRHSLGLGRFPSSTSGVPQ